MFLIKRIEIDRCYEVTYTYDSFYPDSNNPYYFDTVSEAKLFMVKNDLKTRDELLEELTVRYKADYDIAMVKYEKDLAAYNDAFARGGNPDYLTKLVKPWKPYLKKVDEDDLDDNTVYYEVIEFNPVKISS